MNADERDAYLATFEAEFREAMAARHLRVVPDLEQTWTCRRCGVRYSLDANDHIAAWEMDLIHDCSRGAQ